MLPAEKGRLPQSNGGVMEAIRTVEEMEADLGEKLKRLRLNKNLDQNTLAARAGVSVRALRNLEGGDGTTVRTLLSIVRALGRESWLQTVAPVPTINPVTFTGKATPRLRATNRNVLKSSAQARLRATAGNEPEAIAPTEPKVFGANAAKRLRATGGEGAQAAAPAKKRAKGPNE